MSSLLYIVVVSVVLLLFAVVLFAVEDRRQRRYGEPLRTFLDRTMTAAQSLVQTGFVSLGRIGRIIVHYGIHTVLVLAGRVVGVVQRLIEHLKLRNRSVVRAIREKRTITHLTEMADHKRQSALSEKERRALRERHLNGE